VTDRPLVLVVEDDPGVRGLLETSLRLEGFEVEAARDGLEGLLKIRMRRPAAVVLDLSMPGVGGLRLLDELDEEGVLLPIVVVTGDLEAGGQARERLGSDNVFTKPFDIDELSARLHLLARAIKEPDQ
jgi:DNA-binding response OmpR family regulator